MHFLSKSKTRPPGNPCYEESSVCPKTVNSYLTGRSAGTAIDENAILTHNHLDPIEETECVMVTDAWDNPVHIAHVSDVAMASDAELGGGLGLLVFKDNFMAWQNAALLGDADGLRKGDSAQQAVVRGVQTPGLYFTEVVETNAPITNERGKVYRALKVLPDRTVRGDSGSGLYVDGRVYGVNNSGVGNYGPVTEIRRTHNLIALMTGELR